MQGVKHRRSSADFHVIRVHYSADPEKSPMTTAGRVWLERESKGYIGGMGSQKWRQEMEIDWEAMGGELVFPWMEMYESKLVIPPFEIPEGWFLFGSYDYGHRNPTAFKVDAFNPEGEIYTVWEYYKAGQGYRDVAKAIRECPYFDRLSVPPIADPSIWALNQNQGDNEVKSIAQLFTELPEHLQIHFMKGKKGGDITAAEKIKGFLWKNLDTEQPKWRIFANCPWTFWELKRLRYADWSEGLAPNRNMQESIIDKDNHLWDCTKMMLNMFFASPMAAVHEDPALEQLRKEDPLSYKETQFIRNFETKKAKDNITELLK